MSTEDSKTAQTVEARARNISHNVRCTECGSQSIEDSQADIAILLRKTGDHTRQAYEKKCLQLRNQDAKGADARSVNKTRTNVRDLYTRIWVALRSVETISKRIEKVRDEELQPQPKNLIEGSLHYKKPRIES